MTTYFISDLHLHESKPDKFELLKKFLTTRAIHADALYILGDFFDAWIGDDDDNIFINKVKKSLQDLNDRQIPIYFMRGNRDFLIDKHFIKETKCILLQDPSIIDIYGKRVLLAHGDLLCTNDKNYLRFRKIIRFPLIRKFFLALPLKLRRFIATKIRTKSTLLNRSKYLKDPSYFNVPNETVNKYLQHYKVDLLIHGHTHKPAIHEHIVNNSLAKRIVLGEWTENAKLLSYTPSEYQLLTFK